MKLHKKIIITLFLILGIINNLKAENLELNLAEFATFASQTNNINILLDDSLKDKNIIFIINDSDSFLLEAFEKAVSLKGLELVKTDKFYYVREKDLYIEDITYRPIKLHFVSFEDIKNFLLVYTDIKYEFINTSKTLLIASKEKEFNSIKEMINTIDTLPKQLKLKVTILDTNLDKLKEYGADLTKIDLSTSSNYFFNLISYPFSVNNQLPTTEKNKFYSFLKIINQNGISEFLSNPVLTLSDEKETVFDVVNNIAFKTGESSIQDTTFATSNRYDYKDVGLQIKVTPHIYSDNNVYLDLELNVSNLLSNNDNLPTTSKKFIKQSFHISTNKLLVLTGLNKKEILTNVSSVPLLSEIPFLGWLFKYKSEDTNNTNLSVVFELINEKDFDTKNFNIIVPNKIEG